MTDNKTDVTCVEAIAMVATDFMAVTVKDDSPADVVAEYFRTLEDSVIGAVVAISLIYKRDSGEIHDALVSAMNHLAGT